MVTHRQACDAAVSTRTELAAQGLLPRPRPHGNTSAVHRAGSHHAIAAGAQTSRLSGFPSHLWLAKSPWRSKLTVYPLGSGSEKPHFSQSLAWRLLPAPPNTHFSLTSAPSSPQGVGCVCVAPPTHACWPRVPCTGAGLFPHCFPTMLCGGSSIPSLRRGNWVQLREDKRFICTGHWAS